MYKLIKITIFLLLSFSILHGEDTAEVRDREISVRKAISNFGEVEQKDISTVNKFRNMFSEGKVTGQARSMYAGYSQEADGESDSYGTAVGGMLKYELASFNGFNAGVAFTTSQDMNFASGSGVKHNPELSSQDGHYTELSEAYINYKNGGLNIRLGRQMIDTPLADTDDTRMVPNTFEAYMLSYEMQAFTFTLGNIQRWQGAGAGLGYDDNGIKQDSNWHKSGTRGTWMAGMNYNDLFEFNAWYYDISSKVNATKAGYFDIGNHKLNGDISFHYSLQYLHEREVNNSGVDADIYGGLVEFVYHGLGFNLAYNRAVKHDGKRSFAGIGGGSTYTSMDTMNIDSILEDRDAEAFVGGLVYTIEDWEFLYAYGAFKGKENSAGVLTHIVEQNVGFQYSFKDEFVLAAIYVNESDNHSIVKTTDDWDRLQVMIKYDF